MGENRLAEESSLYLRQHASNPVEWWPWCDEAFAVAKAEDKPVLISIGYSSCHWCHVMAHECFKDGYIAGLMNRLFVNIKVDREERPDVDQIYMEAVQMLNQQGGWPLNVFCFPDKRPFMGGTYFPPEDRGNGLIPWPHLLVRVAEAYRADRVELEKNAEAITGNLKYLSGPLLDIERQWDESILNEGARTICSALDRTNGGFGDAPKFPPSQMMGYLYAVRSTTGDESLREEIDDALELCAKALVRGGLFDHLGGGFFRYSVDTEWRVPHFEKMLYDNALILEILTKLWSRYRMEEWVKPVEQTIDWLLSEFQVGDGVFASALDADTSEGEGAYYLWTKKEIVEAIGDSTISEELCRAFSIHDDTPTNLYPRALGNETYRQLSEQFPKLKSIRDRRPGPARDDKILLSWNALALRSLCLAGFVFNRREWLEKAQEGLDWIWNNLRLERGRLGSVYYPDSGVKGEGFLDDYVNLALANFQMGAVADWLNPGSSRIYLDRGKSLIDRVLSKFGDKAEAGFYFCSEASAAELIVRKKEWYDNAYPSGNSSVVHALSYLAAIADEGPYASVLGQLRQSYVEKARRMPNGVAFGLEGLTWDHRGIVVLKVGADVKVDALMDAIRSRPWRPFVLRMDESLESEEIQLCIGTQCTRIGDALEEILKAF